VVSFARYKRPAAATNEPTGIKRKVSLENFGYNSAYNEQFSMQYNNKINRYSAHTNRNYLPQKSGGGGKIAYTGLNKSYTHDQREENKNFDYETRNNANANQDIQIEKISQKSDHGEGTNSVQRLRSPLINEDINKNVNQTIVYEDKHESIMPKIEKTKLVESPRIQQSHTVMKVRPNNRLYDSLDQHVSSAIRSRGNKNEDLKNESSPYSKFIGSTREDVIRNTLEQDRYVQRLNVMNSKQQQIFQKHLEHHLIPIKDKEKKLEEIEKQKRIETKRKLDDLEIGSRMHQAALKREYQKFLDNQLKERERKVELQNQAKREMLNEMKTFSQMEKEKDRDEKVKKQEMQSAYRSALRSQEILNSSFQREQVGFTVGYKGDYDPRKGKKDKDYLPPNPIVYPISDPMYNPYLRKDISLGGQEISR